ncbi:MAG: energy transducer TonB [Acidobacteria bacterium]|nr:energy transducer TonB [Acidobacteriota bacterium]
MPFNSRSSSLLRAFFALLICVVTIAPLTFAQENRDKESQDLSELAIRPIYVTARVFQMKAKRDSYQDLSDQVFKMKTASLADHEKWVNAFKKTYPGFDIALLRTEPTRVYRTSKPAVISLGKRPDGRDIEIIIYGAQSIGDGVTPGTNLIPEVGLHFGNDRVYKPVVFAIQPIEVESGTTYFFTTTKLKLDSTNYVKFIRQNMPAEPFEGDDLFLIFAFSVDLDKTARPARYFDERESVELQRQATKKAEPEIPADLRQAGLGGFIRVRVEISPEGKVTSANIYHSSFPEMNGAALAAARQWEFPTTLFAENKDPITGFLTFSFAARTPAPKAATQNSDKQ